MFRLTTFWWEILTWHEHFEEFVPVVRRRPFRQHSIWPKYFVHHHCCCCYSSCCFYSFWRQDWQWRAKRRNRVAFVEPPDSPQRLRRTERHCRPKKVLARDEGWANRGLLEFQKYLAGITILKKKQETYIQPSSVKMAVFGSSVLCCFGLSSSSSAASSRNGRTLNDVPHNSSRGRGEAR